MADRTVTVRLRLDASQWAAGSRNAEASTQRLAGRAQAAATAAERSAQRTAQAVAGTFSGVARQGQTSLAGLESAASRSSQALARSGQAMTRQTAQAAAQSARATEQASTAAASGTRRVEAAASGLPAAFRAAGASASAALGEVTTVAAGSSQALTGVESRISAATVAAATGASQLSLANRLAMAEAAQASQAAAARTASAAAASQGAFAQVAARARVMGSAIASTAGRSENALKAARTASLGLVAAFGLAVYASSKFETAMSGVRAATQASGRELQQLRQAAIDAGSTTQYSATQAAEAETELAKAGVSTSDILGGALKGTLALAASGQLDVADAAVGASKAMNAFGMSGSQMSHIADVIASAAGKSATDVHGMSLALAQSALLAHQTGLSIEQTAGALALFAQNGLVGSDAGTSLKTMLMRLTPQSAEAQQMMEKLGFSAYDSQGRFVGLTEVAARMQQAFGKLSPEARNAAMGVIFGADAIRAATIVTQAGAKGIDTWTKAANDQGYAARYAATQTDNLSGDLQRLKSALETAFIQSGSAANGVLRDMAKALTGVVRWYNDLPHGVQQSVTILGGLAGVVGLVASGLLLALPRIMAVRRELVALGVTSANTRTALMGLGRLSVVAAGLMVASEASSALVRALEPAPPNVTKLTASLVQLAQGSKMAASSVPQLDNFGWAVARIAHPDLMSRIMDMGDSLIHFGDDSHIGGYVESKQKIDSLDQSLAALVQSGNADVAAKAFAKMSAEAEKSGTSADKLKGMLPKYTDALTTADTQQKLTADSQSKLGDAVSATTDEMRDQRTEAEKLSDTLNALNGTNISAASAQISFRQSLADLTTAVKDNGRSLDVTTTKGRAVKQAYLDAAKAALDHAQAVTEQTNSQDKGRAAYAADIAALKATMRQAGFTTTQIARLSAQFAKLPAKSETQIKADTAQAVKDLQAVRDKVAATKGKTITMTAPTADAQEQLKALGFKIKNMKGKNVVITVPTGSQKTAVDALKTAIDALQNKNVTITTTKATIFKSVMDAGGSSQAAKNAAEGFRADGSIDVYRYASGGMRENHIAQIARPGEWRIWAEDETGGEAYIPLAVSKRARSRAIAEETVRRLGGKGVAWNADGAVRAAFASGGFTYAPADPMGTLGAGTGMDRYTAALGKLSDAVSRLHSATTKAEKAAAGRAIAAADKTLGLRSGTTSTAFNLKSYQQFLAQAAKANARWESDLAKIGKRAGSDVEETLRGMGEEGRGLVGALAQASTSQFNAIVANLKRLAPTAKATLADYTNQLKATTTVSKTFQNNLLKLASMGYGDLAAQLAAQGDDAAAGIATAAVKSSGAAAAANSAAKSNAALLSSDDLGHAMTLLGVLRSKPGAGIADVLAAGLDWSTVKALAPKIAAQVKAASGSDHLVQQLRGQGVAMARGGILTRPTNVLAAEAGVPESYIPWNGSARSAALLAKTATALGYRLVPAGRYAAGSASTAAVAREVTRQLTINLYGAKQTAGEQAADIARVLNFVG